MTSVGAGHPDWMAYSNWRGQTLFQFGLTVPNGTTDVGTIVTTNFAALFIHASCDVGHGFLSLDYYDDANLTNLITQDGVIMQNGVIFDVLVPVLGNAVDVSITNNAVGNMTIDVYVEPTNIAVTTDTMPIGPSTVSELNTSVAHSATNTVSPNQLLFGNAYVSFIPHDTSGKLTLDIYGTTDAGVLQTHLFTATPTTAPAQQLLILNGDPITYTVKNTDTTTAHVYDLAIITNTK